MTPGWLFLVAIRLLGCVLAAAGSAAWAGEIAVGDPVKPIAELHARGTFLPQVYDETRAAYLVPTYKLLSEQLEDASDRVEKDKAWTFDPDDAPPNFQPYPPLPIPVQKYRSTVIAIIDSGILPEHPLLAGRIVEMVDFTGEGAGDKCGHGTIEAIRHLWQEPRARLLIVKAFDRTCRAEVGNLIAAINYLRRRTDVGYVFVAGGVDVNQYSGGWEACRIADEVVGALGLTWGKFVATTGNIGSAGRWCPAEAEHVEGIQVADSDTYERPSDGGRGFGVLQKGPHVSFPEITPLPLPDFYVRYGYYFLERRRLDLAEKFGRHAEAFEVSYVDGIRLRAAVAFHQNRRDDALQLLQEALAKQPRSPILHAEIGSVLVRLGRYAEAAPHFDEAYAALSNHPDLLFHYALFREATGDRGGALESMRQAASLSATYVKEVIALGGRAFYADDFDIALRATQEALRLDPTRAATWFNAVIIHALAGRPQEALSALDRAREQQAEFDTSERPINMGGIRQAIEIGNTLALHRLAAYAFAEERVYAAEFAELAGLVRLFDWELDARLLGLKGPELDRLAKAVLAYADRLLLRPTEPAHAVARRLLGAFRRAPAATWSELAARAAEAEARLARRLGERKAAVDLFEQAAAAWGVLSVRRQEQALVQAGLTALVEEDHGRAKRLFEAALAYSILFTGDEAGQSLLTTATPEILSGQALLALAEGDLNMARDAAHRAFLGGETHEICLLTLAVVSIKEGRMDLADDILAAAIKPVLGDEDARRRMDLLLLDLPILNAVFADTGESIRDVLGTVERNYRRGRVTLISSTSFPVDRLRAPGNGRPLFPFGPCNHGGKSQGRVVRVAILGTGLMDHPCLAGRVIQRFDATGEGAGDSQGASTAQALAFLALSGDSVNMMQLVDIKIIGRSGSASVDALVTGLVAAHTVGADIIMTHVQTDAEDTHLAGLVERIGRARIINATAPDEGRGRGFPNIRGVIISTDRPQPDRPR
jgi:tetratricopeptide (TPR) repeat protein